MVDIKERLERKAAGFHKTTWNTEKTGFLGIYFFDTYISKHYIYINKDNRIVDYFALCAY